MRVILLFACTLLQAAAQILAFSGKVVMPGGGPPPRPVAIEKICGNWRASVLTRTGRDGAFLVRLEEFDTVRSFITSRRQGLSMSSCRLRASLPGYQSSVVELDALNPTGEPVLPDIRLTPRSGAAPDLEARAPKSVQKQWRQATLLVRAEKWSDAGARLRQVTSAAPDYAPGWALAGLVAQKLDAPEQALAAFQKAVAADPKTPAHRYLLLEAQIKAGQWESARDNAVLLAKADTGHRFPEARIYEAIARYNLRDIEGAAAAASEAIRLDHEHRFPRAELVLGRVLEFRGEPGQALEHYRRFLDLDPGAPEAATLRSRAGRLAAGERLEPETELAAVELRPDVQTEVWIPGGFAALGRIAHIEGSWSPEDFFANYCQALVRYVLPNEGSGIPGYLDSLRAYFLAVRELARSTEPGRADGRVVLALDPSNRERTGRILTLLGWRLAGHDRIELGDTPADGPKQSVVAALGIDAVAMERTLNAGGKIEIEIRTDHARLRGGDAWLSLVQTTRPLSGGLAEAFAEQPLLAKAYSGLSRVPPEIAALIPSALGARNMASRYADLVYRHAPAFRLSGSSVAVPGGESAVESWHNMAGASPENPVEFVRAVFNKDRGTMASFYAAVARADEPRQRWVMAHAPHVYQWYSQVGIQRTHSLIETLPLDDSGRLRWPGGAAVWKTDAGALPDAVTAERVVELARIEDRRGAPLQPGAVALLLRHYDQWSPLFPYLENLREWGEPGALALERYTARLSTLSPVQREQSQGEFYSLLEFAVLGIEAGSLDHRRAAGAFAAACESWDPAAVLRIITGGLPLARFLHLDEGATRRFQQVLDLQKVPELDATDPRARVLALAGHIYAARLSPSGLLVSEDGDLLRRHRFAMDGPALFAKSQLVRSPGEGSRFQGGFAGFRQLAESLAAAPLWTAQPDASASRIPAAPQPASGAETPPAAPHVFRADSRLVMAHVTVTDARGHYVDGLGPAQFQVMEEGEARPPVAFESLESGVSCALLLDTTASMHLAMPSLKSAALRFIQDLRPVDSVAVYGFSDSLRLLHPFTRDKESAQRIVLGVSPSGQTALYDALARLTRELGGRGGKKVIVLFTDGEDNASTLASQLVLQRMRALGTPVYTVAQGQALQSPNLVRELAELSKGTGGLPFQVEAGSGISPVFERIAQDLAHGYLISFTPSPSGRSGWRRLEVVVKSSRRLKVRAREGYSLE